MKPVNSSAGAFRNFRNQKITWCLIKPDCQISLFDNSLLAWLFLVYALPTVLLLSVIMAPFQVADEYAHAYRADEVSRGKLISSRGGGDVDGALFFFSELYFDMPFHVDVKQTVEKARKVAALNWGMPDHNASYNNTAQYGPLLYLPQAVGIWSGKTIGLTPAWTILCARLINGFAAAFIGFIALRLCRRGRALMFTTLLLPMTMSEFASVSQDALIISLSILAGALVSRVAAEQRPVRTLEFSLIVFIVVATTLARISQIALAAVCIAGVRWPDLFWRRKLAIGLIGLVCIGVWMIILPELLQMPLDKGRAHEQFEILLRDPLVALVALWKSLCQNSSWLYQTVVGRLGWVDTALPHWYYSVSIGALVCAWLAPGNGRPYRVPAAIGLVTFALMLVAIGVALFVSWTDPGKSTIDGLQGRYMLPVLPLLAWASPIYRADVARVFSPTWLVVVVFPLVSISVLPGTIMSRYYESWSQMGAALKAMYLS
jgi:uncharacterized membrane protein